MKAEPAITFGSGESWELGRATATGPDKAAARLMIALFTRTRELTGRLNFGTGFMDSVDRANVVDITTIRRLLSSELQAAVRQVRRLDEQRNADASERLASAVISAITENADRIRMTITAKTESGATRTQEMEL